MATISLFNAAFQAVSDNEVSGNPAIADRITYPNPSRKQNGNGGWTIGFDQEDFMGNATTAQAT
ncbi:MAG TPA: hypothetical protein DCP92_14640 [Nitrospiraceae bacterium]|jgi:hypothetical protein|nr:hypothetical protein [Nitrospiraceae bacterium]